MNVVDEGVLKAVGAFGGGIASTGSVCGALLGGVAFISSIYASGSLTKKDDPRMWRLSYKFSKKFKDIASKYGGINCAEIARVNWSDREAARDFHMNPDSRHKICAELVGEAAFALGAILDNDAKQD